MQKARCRNPKCLKILGPEDKIWQVRTGRISDLPVYAPCCSEACAKAVQNALAEKTMAEYNDVMRQSFQIMQLKDFGPE